MRDLTLQVQTSASKSEGISVQSSEKLTTFDDSQSGTSLGVRTGVALLHVALPCIVFKQARGV